MAEKPNMIMINTPSGPKWISTDPVDPRETSMRIPSPYDMPPEEFEEQREAVLPERFRKLAAPTVLFRSLYTTVLDCAAQEKKVIKITGSKRFEQMFRNARRECEILWELRDNPGVLKLYDYEIDEAAGTVYMLEEKGTTLRELHSGGYIRLDEIPAIGIGLCDALIQCRDSGVFHLDLSLSNIYYDSGRVRLGDFGAARHTDSLRQVTSPDGTVKYIAPESFFIDVHDERSELYSAAMALYTMLNAGWPAFCPDYPPDRAFSVRMIGEPLTPSVYEQEYPEEIGTLGNCLRKACAFDPDDRFQSFEELKEAIERAQSFMKDLKTVICVRNYGDKERTLHFSEAE